MRLFMLILIGLSCEAKPPEYSYDAEVFTITDLGMTMNGEAFTGILVQKGQNTTTKTPYRNGQIHGELIEFNHRSQKTLRVQPYQRGKKHGEQIGYYPNGQLKFISHVEEGLYHGVSKKYYDNGQMYSYTLYEKGEVKGHKLWRKNGRIYSNYVYRQGKKYGLDGGKLCFTAKDDKGATP